MPTNPATPSDEAPPSDSPKKRQDNVPGNTGKKTYFGLGALIIGIVSGLFLAANFGVAYLDILPVTFGQLNTLTAFLYCILAPLALIFAAIGYMRKSDSRQYSLIAFAVVLLPFFVLMIEFFYSLKTGTFRIQ